MRDCLSSEEHCGAAEARRAHNPEGSGSKPDSAIYIANKILPLFLTQVRLVIPELRAP